MSQPFTTHRPTTPGLHFLWVPFNKHELVFQVLFLSLSCVHAIKLTTILVFTTKVAVDLDKSNIDWRFCCWKGPLRMFNSNTLYMLAIMSLMMGQIRWREYSSRVGRFY